MVAPANRSRAFIAIFALAALTQFAILLATPVHVIIDGFSGRLAAVSAGLIKAFGGICLQQAAILSNPARGFAMEVRDGCNGVNVVILLWAAILAYPSNLRWKLIGLGRRAGCNPGSEPAPAGLAVLPGAIQHTYL
jgi:hypothetical protein